MISVYERRFFAATRYLALIAVISSILGSVLMFVLGTEATVTAFTVQLGIRAEGEELPPDESSLLLLMSALDRFMIGIVLLFFAYGVYSLFVRPGRSFSELGLPEWLHVTKIGQLKQVVAEVILVVLFVLFLRIAFETLISNDEDMTLQEIFRFMALPLSILFLAAALRLVELHPKPTRPSHKPETGPPAGVDDDAGDGETGTLADR